MVFERRALHCPAFHVLVSLVDGGCCVTTVGALLPFLHYRHPLPLPFHVALRPCALCCPAAVRLRCPAPAPLRNAIPFPPFCFSCARAPAPSSLVLLSWPAAFQFLPRCLPAAYLR
eukprot:795732-Prymnesium_polylepis.2